MSGYDDTILPANRDVWKLLETSVNVEERVPDLIDMKSFNVPAINYAEGVVDSPEGKDKFGIEYEQPTKNGKINWDDFSPYVPDLFQLNYPYYQKYLDQYLKRREVSTTVLTCDINATEVGGFITEEPFQYPGAPFSVGEFGTLGATTVLLPLLNSSSASPRSELEVMLKSYEYEESSKVKPLIVNVRIRNSGHGRFEAVLTIRTYYPWAIVHAQANSTY
jgi:hypothetical protein